MLDLKIKPSDKILIVAPHPDDETLGCGGLLAKYGPQCDVLLVSNGELGFFETSTVTDPSLVAKIREKEFEDAMNFFKVHKYF
ncbi:MAG: PIG-L family deacetylase [Clostridia bacterium]|nr:PIG-L family deacetylase [Clostridia bacterium]